ncbi:MAG: S-layer homology domain-containing protein, partial [Evtepia sp.]
MKKRGFALFLALALALGLLPMSALAAEDPMGTVTFSIETKTIDGGYLVEPMEEELYAGDTVYTILTRVADELDLTVEGADAGYVTRIGDFSAFGCGDQSGWMVALNDDHNTWPLPELKDGDSVRFCYTYLTYGYDIDLMDLADRLAETCAQAAQYQGDNGEAVAAALTQAEGKLSEIAAYESNQAYLDSVTIYGPDSETSALEALIQALEDALAGPQEGSLPFTDVEGHWALDSIRKVYDLGLMTGTKATRFSPDTALNRAMLVTILYRLEGSPAVSSASVYTDVAAGTWYTDAVAWAAQHGIITGYGNGRFGPKDDITREQMAAILYRYAQYKTYDTAASADLSAYHDAGSISGWALKALQWANGTGLISGRSASLLVPAGSTTRAETAVILVRFLEQI